MVSSKQQHLEGISSQLQKVCEAAIEIKEDQAKLKLDWKEAVCEVRIALKKEGRKSVKVTTGGKVYEIKAQDHESDILVKQISKGQAAEKAANLPGISE